MSRRSRPHYRPGLEWILGVAFPYTLTRPVRLAQGLPFVRCCGSSRASSPHGLTAPGPASHDGDDCVQLPLARGCYHLAPRRTFTSNPVPMPGTHAEAKGFGVMHVEAFGHLDRGFQAAHRHVGLRPDVLLEYFLIIQLVYVIAGEQHDVLRRVALDDVDVLIDRVGGAAIPHGLG